MDIVLKEVSKSYGGKQVLSNFSCTIPEGSVCAVMAPSGTGKTTLLRLILGLEQPDRGEVLDVPGGKGVLFQEDRLCPRLSVLKNIRMAVGKAGAEQAKALLDFLGLADCADQPAGQLSGGQARRAALARALLASGQLLALDEPFTGLDDAARLRAAEAIRAYRRGRTLLLITHRQEDLPLLEVTDRVDLMG